MNLSKEKHSKDIVVVGNNVEQIKENIKGKVGDYNNIYVLHNHGLNIEDVESFHPSQAHVIYIVGSSSEDVNCDLINLNLLFTLNKTFKSKSNLPIVNIYFDKQSSSVYLKNAVAYNFADLRGVNINVRNTDELWARKIILDMDNDHRWYKISRRRKRPMDLTTSEKNHIIIFGMSEIGETVALSAAQTCHFANFITMGIKTQITIIDENFSSNRGLLSGQYSDFMDLCESRRINVSSDGKCEVVFDHKPNEYCEDFDNLTDIKWKFIESMPDSKYVVDYITQVCNDRESNVSIVICGEQESKNYELAFNLPKVICDNKIPIWIYSKTDYKIGDFMSRTMYRCITPWGMKDVDTLKEMQEERVAKLFSYFDSVSCLNNFPKSNSEIREFILKYKIDWNEVEETWSKNSIKDKELYLYNVCYALSLFANGLESFALNDKNGKELITLNNDEKNVFIKLRHVNWIVSNSINGTRSTKKYKDGNIAEHKDVASSVEHHYNLTEKFIPYESLPDNVKNEYEKQCEILLAVIEIYTKEINTKKEIELKQKLLSIINNI